MFFQEYFGAAGNNYCQTFEMRIVDKSVTIHINEKNFELIQVKRFFLFSAAVFLFKGFIDHFAADEGKKSECDPMVEVPDIACKLRAQKPANQGHQRLEAAKEGGNQKWVFPIVYAHIEPFAKRHRECVHGKAERDKKQFDNADNEHPF